MWSNINKYRQLHDGKETQPRRLSVRDCLFFQTISDEEGDGGE